MGFINQIHNWFGMQAYNTTYQLHINSVPSKEFWEKAEGYPLLPSHYKRGIDRPTKKRRKERNEQRPNTNPYKVQRKYGATICNYCGEVGHNSRTCQRKMNNLNDVAATIAAKEATQEAGDANGHNQITLEHQVEAATLPTQDTSGLASGSNPVVSIETINATSQSITKRFVDFMPTPGLIPQPSQGPRPSKLLVRGSTKSPIGSPPTSSGVGPGPSKGGGATAQKI
ncbi:hypothetical protein PIB30_082078 [Stylosanthes scabra]|uniref:CCHC-type domain-containing protein n=1 Tax=Stylosanthes scabra TaxID=79078 RepID=A0ABU6WTG9_9FABA|nr:hypothetical protein [Stylosanthes scabra]